MYRPYPDLPIPAYASADTSDQSTRWGRPDHIPLRSHGPGPPEHYGHV